MEISLKANYAGYNLLFKAENVNIEEDIEERIYEKKEDGTADLSKPPKRDINDDAIEQFSQVLSDIISYRERNFDSSNLIEELFKKLPQEIAEELSNKLAKMYEPE